MNGKELKEQRIKIGLTQDKLANLLGVSLRTVANWEAGSVIPKSKHAMLLSFFAAEISQNDEIMHKPSDISVTDAYEMEYTENNNANTFFKLENGQYLMTMPLAEFNIQAGLLDHYQDIEFLNEMDKHSIIVDEPVRGRYMAFRVKGDSMDDGTSRAIVPNSVVSTRELQRQHWTSKIRFRDFEFWVIYTKDSKYPLLKQIIDHDIEKGTILCHSLNDGPEYSDFTLEMDNVQALFYVVNVYREVSKKSYY